MHGRRSTSGPALVSSRFRIRNLPENRLVAVEHVVVFRSPPEDFFLDDRRFDALTKSFAAGRSRRTLLKGLLGLGGAAVAAGAGRTPPTDAARRPTPTPKPLKCPGVQIPVDGECICPDGLDKCGPACCNETAPLGSPEHSECCDNACCFGKCMGEELCCPTSQLCLGDGTSPDLCCSSSESCCNGGTAGNTCVEVTGEGFCCEASDCAGVCGACNPETHQCYTPEGYSPCGTGCCLNGQCTTSGACCGSGLSPCGATCCELGQCNDSGVCCTGDDIACLASCCPRDVCGSEGCCEEDFFSCGGVCCRPGQCTSDLICCPVQQDVCGAICCGDNEMCQNGQCVCNPVSIPCNGQCVTDQCCDDDTSTCLAEAGMDADCSTCQAGTCVALPTYTPCGESGYCAARGHCSDCKSFASTCEDSRECCSDLVCNNNECGF